MRFGIIGTNFVSGWFLAAGKGCPGFELGAVYSRSPWRAREFGEQYGAARCVSSLEDLAACPVDAVYIASPTACHCGQALLMLRAGKHVLCEKPAASNAKELEAMLAAARKGGLVLMEAVRPAFNPALARLREALDTIGTIRRAALSLCRYSSRYGPFLAGEAPNAFNPALSNGALMDMGVYCVHILLRLFGRPRRIQAAAVKLSNGFDAQGTFLASYGEMTADVHYSKAADSYNPSEIQGEGGSVSIGDMVTLSGLARRRREGKPESRAPASLAEPLTVPGERAAGANGDMIYELEEFIRAAGAGPGSPALALQNRYSMEAMEILDTVRRQCGIVFPADAGSPLP
ncbi:MAG: Gfo/Idh/MocA family oxidoreductase [Treponema sp.]|jgi:predicted dehydrogenase|nr:Gfo/Idh/MocA family oxidoreductase [Treponema sp.]